MEVKITYLEKPTGGSVAVRILPPASEETTPSHFICLVDVSESMNDGDKLSNVKHCLRLLLQILTPQDSFSLITFGDKSDIVLKRVQVEGANVERIRQKIEELHTDGCTNLSAGLAAVQELLVSGGASGSITQKQGLMLLTDGHANRGLCHTEQLREILLKLTERNPGLTCNFLAYGTDHNAELLKGMAADALGSYTIVQDLEGAALGIGDSLGSILSCCAQNVELLVPPGTTAFRGGPYTVKDNRISLGDLYSGTSTLILLDLPNQEGVGLAHELALKGVYMPSLEPFQDSLANCRELNTEFNAEVELTKLRYRCAELFREIRLDARPQLRADIQTFEEALGDARLGGEVVEMLRSEIESLRAALNTALQGRNPTRLSSLLAQHEAYTALGRGAAMPIVEEPEPMLYGIRGNEDDEDDDPVAHPVATTRSSYFLSPTSSIARQRVARRMQHLSQMEGESTS